MINPVKTGLTHSPDYRISPQHASLRGFYKDSEAEHFGAAADLGIAIGVDAVEVSLEVGGAVGGAGGGRAARSWRSGGFCCC